MVILKAINLTKEYEGKDILKEVSFNLETGQALAIIGPIGAGKTTLIKLLDLLEMPTSGTIVFKGIDVSLNHRRRLDARRRMAYVQQKPMLFSMNVFDNVACGLKWRGQRGEVAHHKVERALELVGMNDYAKRNARTLSGGEIQRIAIARALVTEPEVLFLDEPTTNLDPHSTLKIEEVVATVIREKKTAVIMATHDMVQGQRMASRIGVLLGGRLLQIGSPNEIFCAPNSHELAEFVGIENILPGRVINREGNLLTVDIRGHYIQAISVNHLSGNDVYVLVRPEDITFFRHKNVGSARNILSGIISRLTPAGPLMRIEVDCGFPLLGVVTKSAATDLNLYSGRKIKASFKATSTHVIKRWS
jgi:tungstate transport system ATP-binding protein